MFYNPEPRPNIALAVLKAMIPTRKTWRSDLVDYSKIIGVGVAIWGMAWVFSALA